MTIDRAICLLCQMYLPQFDEEEKQAITKAIEALEEVRALKEKNEPKKPRWHGHHFCPNCNSIVYVNGGKDIYCPKCGQNLDWNLDLGGVN